MSKSKLQEVSSYERRLTIEIPFQDIQAEMENQFISLSKTVELKGFRKGNVPLTVIRQQFSQRAKGESISKLIDKHYAQAIDEHRLDPVAYPKIEVNPFENGKPLSFVANVEIKPTVVIEHYEGLALKKEKVVVEDKHIDQALDHLRESKSQLKAVEESRGVRESDYVVIDFKGTVNGKTFPGGTAQNLLYEMGSGRFVPDFEKGIQGMKVNDEKSFEVTFPKGFHEKRLAGKIVQFNVKLREVKSKELPALDDAFAKEIDGCKSVSDIRDKVRDELRQTEENRVRKNLEKNLLDRLVEKNPFEVPPSMVERQFEFLVEDGKRRLQQMGLQGQPLEETLAGWKKDLRERAAFDVKVVLMMEAIIQKEKLEIDEKEITQALEEIAERAGVSLEKARASYQKNGILPQLRWRLLQDKALNWFLRHANIT